jgi:hypothetical protein
MWRYGRPGSLAVPAIILLAAAGGCTLLPGEPPPLRPEDCFGSVPYAISGWTTLAAIGQAGGSGDGPAGGRVYAMVTRDEVVLTVSPPGADGTTVSVLGRGACWTWPGAPGISKASVGGTRTQPNP